MSLSGIFILDLKGKPLISRSYRGDTDNNIIDKFIGLALESEEEGTGQPIVTHMKHTFAYIKYNNLYLVGVTRRNANVAIIFTFLHKLRECFVEYFHELEEESIKDNFVLIYELLDELMDFGYPQTTETKILKEFITQESHKLVIAPRPPPAVTNAVSWRKEGIKYRKNECFLDVVESLNLLVNASGTVLRSEILGSVKLRVHLTGMPELRLGLNDKIMFENTGRNSSKGVELEDVKFHQCVRLSRFDVDRTISFIPPDGEFELMSYRLTTPVKPIIWIETSVERPGRSKVELLLKAIGQFKKKSIANNVEVLVPVPSDAISPKFSCPYGVATYRPDLSAIRWIIKSFPGGKEFPLYLRYSLPSIQAEDGESLAPITVKFEIPYFTTSGIQVRYLKIMEKSGYQALPWVRYITQNGDYQIRSV